MRKELLAITVAALLVVATRVEAGPLTGRPVGCVALERAVYTAVLDAAAGVAGGVAYAERGRGGLLECTDTAGAVSAGFTQAMAERNVYLSWKWPDEERGDRCLSADLSQCYPNRNPFVPFARGDAAFAAASWQSLVRAVGRTMPRGYAGNRATFSAGDLAAWLALELRRGAGGRAQQHFYIR